MNNNILKSITLGGMLLCLVMPAFADADSFVFEPRTTSGYSYIETPQPTTGNAPKATSNFVTTQTALENPRASANYQNAILELDNAQVEIRTRLLDYKSKYSEVNQKYEDAKTERKALKKLIKDTEKSIKNIDKTKDKIRKEML